MTTVTSYKPRLRQGRDGFAQLVHAEWTKFRTVRGWVIAVAVGMLATIGLGLVSGSSCNGGGCPAPPQGPGGDQVQDDFYFVHQPMTPNGTITVRMTALTGMYVPITGRQPANGNPPPPRPGLQEWSKAGIMIKANTTQGSAYAAMLVTGGHGVRMQWNFTHDVPGSTGGVQAPRWLRLVRDGDAIRGYYSADGTRWHLAATASLPGLPATAQVGLFAASPQYAVTTSSGIGGSSGNISPTVATGTFDHVGLSWPGGAWSGDDVGGDGDQMPGHPAGFRQRSGSFAVTGTGDIAPLTANTDAGGGVSVKDTLIGTFAGLIAVVVIAAMFITTEYRRGLIKVTLTAAPRRTRVLAAKAVVLAAIGFAAGVVALAIAIPLGVSRLRSGGISVMPVPTSTEIRIIAGTGLTLAVAAMLALAIGTAVRRSAVAVGAVIMAVFVPYLLATVPGLLPLTVQEWLLRVTPAAAFSVQQVYPAYAQVATPYRPVDGYYPLAPWAGFAVLCAWAIAAGALAALLLRRRAA